MISLLVLLQVAILSGTVSSSHLPAIHPLFFEVFPFSKSGLFAGGEFELKTTQTGTFKLQFFKADLYRLYVTAPEHKHIRIEIFVDRPEKIDLNITLPISSLDSGEFFTDPEYVNWIRVSGSFNDFSYETGIPFRATGNPGEIEALLPANTDTMWYKITGLSNSGNPILPGAVAIKHHPEFGFLGGIYSPEKPARLVYNATTWPDKRTDFENYVEARDARGNYIRKILKTNNSDWLEAQVELVELKMQNSGFAKNPVTRKHVVFKDLSIFQHMRDSLTAIVSGFPDPKNLSTYQKVVQMRFISAILEQLEIEESLGKEAPGYPISQKEATWKLFNTAIKSVPPASPLWRVSPAVLSTAPVVVDKYPSFGDIFLQIAQQTPDDNFSLELFDRTITELHSVKEKKKAKAWLKGMEKRFPKHFKTTRLKTDLNRS